MNKIYIAHPFGGDQENVERVQDIITDLVKRNPEVVYVSPLHMFGHLYDVVSYEQGMEWCLEILQGCDAIVFASDEWYKSQGCCMEYEFAKENGIQVFTLPEYVDELDEADIAYYI